MSCGRSYQKEVSEMAKVQLSTRIELMRHSDLVYFESELGKTSKKPRSET